MDKVLLILVDGMRPDSIAACGSEYADNMLKSCRYKDMQAKTVFPSVTLPCHMSLFHSVVPQRHGILTNTFVPMARPVDGLIEKLHNAGKRCAFYYTWEQLRDLAKPGMLDYSLYSAMFHEQGDKGRPHRDGRGDSRNGCGKAGLYIPLSWLGGRNRAPFRLDE